MDKSGRTHDFENHSDHCVLVLHPPMNACPWSDIERVGDDVLRELEAINTPHLIVDLSELDYIGSAMVALMVRIWKVVKAKKARMVVVNRNPMVLEVFKISKLDGVWNIMEFREDALYELGVSQEAKKEHRQSTLLVAASVLTALAGAGAVGVHLAKPGLLEYPLLPILGFGGSALGAGLGLLLSVKGAGGQRALGIVATIVSLAALAGAFCWIPLNSEPVPKPDEKAQQESPDTEQQQPAEDQAQSPQPEDSAGPAGPAVAEKPPASPEE